jgi:hypothetical protein
LALKAKTEAIIEKCFDNSKPIKQTEKESFETFMGQESLSLAEWLASCFNKMVKRQHRGETQKPDLEDLMKIFRFNQSKDHFITVYQELLTHRLMKQNNVG